MRPHTQSAVKYPFYCAIMFPSVCSEALISLAVVYAAKAKQDSSDFISCYHCSRFKFKVSVQRTLLPTLYPSHRAQHVNTSFTAYIGRNFIRPHNSNEHVYYHAILLPLGSPCMTTCLHEHHLISTYINVHTVNILHFRYLYNMAVEFHTVTLPNDH